MIRRIHLSKFIILSGLLFVSISQVFAVGAQPCDPNSLTDQLANLLDRILALFSRLWIPFAIIAGKLMGNGFIYWEFFNLDKVLYFLRNMSRTFANFMVVVLIIGELIKQFWDWGIDGPKTMKYIIKMWWAIILANLSRFIIGATIDVSTILTTTVSALPSTYIAQDSTAQNTMSQAIGNAAKQSKQTIHLDVKQCDGKPTITFENKDSDEVDVNTEELMDMILPWENSVTWPLMYLWIGVLRLQDFLNTTNIPNDNLTYKLFVISTRVGITLLFMIALIVLAIINIFRIVAIWFFVSFAPLLILLKFADQEKSYQIGLLEKFSIQNMIKSIFSPVIAVWLMSIGLIVIVVMQWFLQFSNNKIEFGDVIINNEWSGSVIGVDGIFQTTMAWDLFGQDTGNLIKNTFSNILLIVFTLFILYGIVKALASFLKDGIWGEFIEKAVNLWWQAISSLPMIPIPWLWGTSMAALSKTIWEKKRKIMSGLWTWSEQNTAVDNRINKLFWLPQVMDYATYRPLQKHIDKISKQNYPIDNNDFNKFFELYKPIQEFYNQEDQQKLNNSLSSMTGIKDTLEIFLKKASESNDIKAKYEWTKLWSWTKSDGTVHTIDSYITENYKTNKKFFEWLYERLWGDKSKLNTDWSNFRSQSFQRKQ